MTTPAPRANAICDATDVNKCLVIESDGSINVNGSFSATLAGFTPNGNVANLSVTTSSANVALPAGLVVAVLNSGATDASIKLSVGAGSAATTDFVLKSGATVGLTVGSNTFINAITASSTTTLSMAGGTGLVSGYGGGSSGGAGSAVTAVGTVDHDASASGVDPLLGGGYASAAAPTSVSADGDAVNAWYLRNGAQATVITAAGALVGGDATNGLDVDVTRLPALVAGSAVVGKVGIDQTTPGTTNAVYVSGSVGVAQAAAISGITLSPIGAESLSTTPTRTTAQVDIPLMNLAGSLCVQPYGLPDKYFSGLTASMTGTTSTAVTGAGAVASMFNYITQLTVGNSDATVGTFVDLQDGNGGTVFYTVPAAALYGGVSITFNPPLKQPTANTALYAVCKTTSAEVIVSVNGYRGV